MRLSIWSFVLFAACVTQRPPGRGRSTAARGSSTHFSHPPIVDGSRLACLAPPYTPAPGATALADGTPIRRNANGRQWILSLRGDAPPTNEQAEALVQRLRARGEQFAFVTYGLYCGPMPTGLCLSYAGNLCELRVEEIARTLLTAIAADPELPHPRIELAINLAGNTGPRCGPTDPACGPVPYEHGASFDPNRPRRERALEDHSIGTCRRDGECIVAGCGNHCVSWEYGGANEGATCEGYVFQHPIFCGCISGECGWFSQ